MRHTHRTAVALCALAVAALSLSACVSAPPPPTSSAAAAKPEAEQRCPAFTAGQLSRTLGQPFSDARVDPSSTDAIIACQWTAKSQAALVLTKVATQGGRVLFEESRDASARSIGAVNPVTIRGARSAYVIPSLGRVGMLVDDRFVEVSVLVPSADGQDVARLATLAARNAV